MSEIERLSKVYNDALRAEVESEKTAKADPSRENVRAHSRNCTARAAADWALLAAARALAA